MNYSKLASKLRSKIGQFSGYVSTGLDKTSKRFVGEAIYGIIYSQSVMLTEIGRSLETEVSLKKIEERFCRQLKKDNIWECIHQRVLKEATAQVKEDTLLILDLSDIHKKYARKMEYLAKVRDGSDGGTIVNGYWSTQVIGASLGSNELLPLYHELYSQKALGFKSENNQIIKAIDMVSEHTGDHGIWVIDRGGDRDVLYASLLDKHNPKRFIIRLVGNRHLVHGKSVESALKLAHNCKTPYSDTIVREENGQEKAYHISYGYMPVKLPDHDQQLYMLVVNGTGDKPMMILTTEPLRRNRKVLYRMLGCYLKRWSIEETIRFIKQTYGLENIRVLKYQRLKNMMALLLAVFYFIAKLLDTNQKLKIMTGHVFRQAKRIFGIPDFKYYALGDGLSAIFKRSPGNIRAIEPPKLDPAQLGLGFT
jgi:Transposase DDE domain